jgi:hypothetical protein
LTDCASSELDKAFPLDTVVQQYWLPTIRAEFQKFIDHRGLVVNFHWGALARLKLARAYAMQGDSAKARAAYQDFLTLWKDADPGISVLKQAQAEYAKLK